MKPTGIPDTNIQVYESDKKPKLPKPKTPILPELKPFTGIWIRKDLVKTIQSTQSLFKTREIINAQAFSDFLALAIEPNDQKKDTLLICVSTFFTQMPATIDLGINQKKQYFGYQATAQWEGYPNHRFYVDLSGEDLIMTIQQGAQSGRFVFQKVSKEDGNICSNQVREAYNHLIIGKYQLLDKNNRVIQAHIHFDEEGNANFPGFKHYQVRIGYQNSIHHSMDVRNQSPEEKKAMLQNGALDQEDQLIFYKVKDHYESSYSYAIEKSQEEFHIYTLQKQENMMWQLLYKKELAYKLIPLAPKKKIK